jgi:hypothetical protein
MSVKPLPQRLHDWSAHECFEAVILFPRLPHVLYQCLAFALLAFKAGHIASFKYEFNAFQATKTLSPFFRNTCNPPFNTMANVK